ncbi:hypothetical protein TrRE_jg11514 [Triparma retinervis]|uniref:Uncharacterized protein n=1 Tax=Triparma retinervis TaxID=2557542 RepID=A0A9W7AAN0_9STRA|nr:hypothetical protein TrRE_jg11514 [Triparma retinervis]
MYSSEQKGTVMKVGEAGSIKGYMLDVPLSLIPEIANAEVDVQPTAASEINPVGTSGFKSKGWPQLVEVSKASETGKRAMDRTLQLETRLDNDLNKANIEISKGNTTTVGYKNAMQVSKPSPAKGKGASGSNGGAASSSASSANAEAAQALLTLNEKEGEAGEGKQKRPAVGAKAEAEGDKKGGGKKRKKKKQGGEPQDGGEEGNEQQTQQPQQPTPEVWI